MIALSLLLAISAQGAAGWKNVPLPFHPSFTLELPPEAKPGLLGGEWTASLPEGGATLPGKAGLATAFSHQFEENPLSIDSYSEKQGFESRVKDLAVALCFFENADYSVRCPPEEIRVERKITAWGEAYLVAGNAVAKRGPVKEHFDPARMLVVKTGKWEGVVFRSLRGEIRDRLLARLGFRKFRN